MLKINRNIFWSNLFIDFLINNGIKYACISPGSRSTPLTFVTATNKSIKSFPIIDERSSAFFALGLSKKTKYPAFIITTSGTAVAELYPAIIEAYQSRTPIIICTADRPARLRNTGANQTINQKNIFKNHIQFSADIPSLEINRNNIKSFLKLISEGFIKCISESSPVHFNFQFDKPFEPDFHTDKISINLIDFATKTSIEIQKSNSNLLTNLIKHNPVNLNFNHNLKPILITIGYDNFEQDFISALKIFSEKNNIPVFADVGSGLKNGAIKFKNLIHNYDTLVRCENFSKIFSPTSVIHFGRNITSNALEEFLIKNKSKRIIVNKFGDRFDSTKKGLLVKSDPVHFLNSLIDFEFNNKSTTDLENLLQLDKEIEKLKSDIFDNSFTEVEIINQMVKHLPDNSNLFVSNSLPIRDLDFFIRYTKKNLKIYTNRGASGIDGIISTALGISASDKNPTYLIIGDLSFYYDINSLLILKNLNNPLKIILINNDGGRIFEYLPISNYKNVFKEFFLTSTGLNFNKIADSFSVNYLFANNLLDLKSNLELLNKSKTSVILEVKVNLFRTLSLKNKFRVETNKLITKFLR